MEFFQQYTLDKTLNNMVLAEEHIKDYLSAGTLGGQSSFCLECLTKHFRLIEGLAEEGVGFFPGEGLWPETAAWASEHRQGLKDLTPDSAQAMHDSLRELRKRLERKYSDCPVCKAASLPVPGKGRHLAPAEEEQEEKKEVVHSGKHFQAFDKTAPSGKMA